MRNLKLKYCKRLEIGVTDVNNVLFDHNGNVVYFATTDKLYKYQGPGPILELAEQPGIVGTEYLALENEICIATEVGEVLLLNLKTGVLKEGTFCDVGIESMVWSPDQDLVVFITKKKNVVVMTCTFDSIAEHHLSEYGGDDQFVSVGWGKKETQFYGSEGKFAAKQRNDFRPSEKINELPHSIEVTWRGDGTYFAVSYVNEDVGRMFKVFDREGKLNYISESLNGLQPPIAWRPSGTWLAVPQNMANKSTIALFEKNGLRHREIILPFDITDEIIISLKWSGDSSILAIETRCGKKSTLNLYTISNYHWYLKQSLCFDGRDAIAAYRWDMHIGEEKTLHVVLQSGCYLIYRWHFSVDKSDLNGIVAVIDGTKLLLSNFSRTVVPPPMYHAKLVIAANINTCSFITNSMNELQICLLDAYNSLHIFKSQINEPLNFVSINQGLFWRENQLKPLELGNILWRNEECLLATVSHGNNSEVILIGFDMGTGEYGVKSKITLSGTICAFSIGSPELDQFFVHTCDGRIQQMSLSADNKLQLMCLFTQLDHVADQLCWYNASGFDFCGLITLQTNGCLYLESKRIALDVTSFCLTGNYLVYTNLISLFFMRLTDRRVVAERKVERGAKLITTIANDARTVLQMPRGNLEMICPRVLALELIGTLLNNRQYYDAMAIVRKHRINLNIICDHNLCEFIKHLDIFLNEVQNDNWLNLFINDLQNEDFTQSMYSSNYTKGNRVYPKGFELKQKIVFICERLCEHMEQRNKMRFRLPIMTTYVKLGKLEKALQVIWQERQRESKSFCTSQLKPQSSSEECCKYLLYLVDVNELYNVALGTYEFGLVLFIAEKSQKDPKEFLPFLNELKTYELHYRKFKIDEYLKRYTRALEHIVHCQSEKRFEEALAFIQRHQMYKNALETYKAQPDCYRRICLTFADYLRTNSKLENASIMYERGGNLSQALKCAKHIMDWRRVLVLSRKENNPHQMASVALSLVPALQDHDRYDEAYELCKTYGDNYTEALRCLLKGKLYVKALFEARITAEQLIEELVLPDLQAYRAVLEKSLAADQELFVSYKQRLLEVRERRAKFDVDGEHSVNDPDECDLLSDTTSLHSSSRYTNNSRGTNKTFRSSKNRRKHERKLLSLKPGNPFEDIALIDALYTLIFRIVNQQQHIRDTCKALLELQLDDAAIAVQRQFKELLQTLLDSLDEIWIPEMITIQHFVAGSSMNYTYLRNEQRYAMIDPQKRFRPQINIIDWEHEILRSPT